VRSPNNSITKPGALKVIPAEGMPIYKSHFQKGHLYIKFDIVFPDVHCLTPEVTQLLSVALPHPEPIPDISKSVDEVVVSEPDPQFSQTRFHSRETYTSDEEDAESCKRRGVSCHQQ